MCVIDVFPHYFIWLAFNYVPADSSLAGMNYFPTNCDKVFTVATETAVVHLDVTPGASLMQRFTSIPEEENAMCGALDYL